MFRIVAYIFSFLIFLLTEISGQYANCNFICNTDFEDEKLVNNGQFGFFDQDRVSCWNTTATDRMIEIWGSGFGGVPAYSGNQFAELNANMVSTLFQNFSAAHGGTVEISFAHRGRAGLDRLSVEIGPNGGPYANLGTFSADNSRWVYNSISYTFPDTGRIDFVIRFNSVSAAGGATVGNFLDAISIKLPQPEADFFITKPTCPNKSNGAIQLNSIHGSLPFRYLWNSPLNSTDSVLTNLSPGNYQLEITDFYGCKITYNLQLDAAYHNDTTNISYSACTKYTWPITGETFLQSGKYSATLQNRGGCDSTINLDLNIQKPDSIFTSISTCDSYTWPANGMIYNQSGIYADTLINIQGCDSILILELNILSQINPISSISVCESYTWPVSGKTYTQSGIYIDTLVNIFGCDSILALNLEILPLQRFTSFVRSCDSYTWTVNQRTYLQSGIYTDTLINTNGCDSILVLDLTILPHNTITNAVRSCDAYTWPVNGTRYLNSGTYVDTLKNTLGCDSILTLNLEILKNQQVIDSIQICNSYFWNVSKQTYAQSGTYHAHYINREGCDSSRILKLQILQSTSSKQSVSACENYLFDKVNYAATGDYTFQSTNAQGCDSTFTLNLTIHPNFLKTDTITQCNQYQWPVSGDTYTQSGNYRMDLKSDKGCDSIHLLHLIIDPTYLHYDTVSAIEQYLWPVNREVYKESGSYLTSFKTTQDCDSLRGLILEIKRRGEVYLPNVFTPNGDGINDKFIVYSSPEIITIDRMLIYDRWGEMLFEIKNFPPNDAQFGWNGNLNSQHLNPAVFVYAVEWTDLEGTKHIEHGDVTLIR